MVCCRLTQKILLQGCSVSCEQTNSIFHCMERLTHITVESGQRRTHKRTQRNSCTHHMFLFGVISTREWLYDCKHVQPSNKICFSRYLVRISIQRHLSYENVTTFFSPTQKNSPSRKWVELGGINVGLELRNTQEWLFSNPYLNAFIL